MSIINKVSRRLKYELQSTYLWLDYQVSKTLGKEEKVFKLKRGKMRLEVKKGVKNNFRRLEINEPYTDKVLKNTLTKGNIVLECGASQGYFTLLISSLIGEEGKCYCFEPLPKYFNMLSTNLELNNIDNVKLINTGVDEKVGNIEFPIDGNTSYAGISKLWSFESKKKFDYKENQNQTIKIPVILLSDYIKEHNIQADLLFTDIEGCEKMVINDLVNNLPQEQMPKNIFMELHPGFYGEENMYNIIKTLEENGYESQAITRIHYLWKKKLDN